MALSAILAEMTTVGGTVSGIKRAHNGPPEQITEWPAWVVLPPIDEGFDIEQGPTMRLIYRPRGQVLVSRKGDTKNELAVASPYVNSVVTAFNAKLTLGGLVDRCAVLGGRFGVVPYGGFDFVAVEFRFEVKERVAGLPSG